MEYPNGSKFAFTVVDDTDHATIGNVKPVYDLFMECGLLTTKTVWVYPPRGSYVGSASLSDPNYLEFVRALNRHGFEIALHCVGDGRFTRPEILAGIELFRDWMGQYPKMQINHNDNPDNLYWKDERFEWPVSALYRLAVSRRANGGHLSDAELYWGDAAKRHCRYIRNLTFNQINTLACDPLMPYSVQRKAGSSNLWFSGSDGHTVEEFTDLISRSNLERLERQRGACIVYTHLAAGFVSGGRVHPEFERRIRSLAARPGWFVPASTLLDHLASRGTSDPGYLYRMWTNVRWCIDRIVKRWRYRR